MSNIVDTPSTGEARDNDDVAVTGAVGGVVILGANVHRKSALIINVGSEPMRVTTDGSPPTPTHGKRIPAGGSLALAAPYAPTKEVKAIREGAIDTIANASEVD